MFILEYQHDRLARPQKKSMESMGLNFRATKDLDIVLILEALDVEFVNAFWNFIKEGQYKNRQKSTGKKLFYRFYDPEKEASVAKTI